MFTLTFIVIEKVKTETVEMMKDDMVTDVIGFSRSRTPVGLHEAFELTGNVALCITSLTIKTVSHNSALSAIFRSAPPSRPNNISGSQMSIRPSIHKKFLRF